jgi:hypothetical protein
VGSENARATESRESPLLEVPSAILPETFNILMNPNHPDAVLIKPV